MLYNRSMDITDLALEAMDLQRPAVERLKSEMRACGVGEDWLTFLDDLITLQSGAIQISYGSAIREESFNICLERIKAAMGQG